MINKTEIDAGRFLYKAQELGEHSAEFWIAKFLIKRFAKKEMVGKLGQVEIYRTPSGEIYAWVKVGLEDGYDVYLGKFDNHIEGRLFGVWV